MEWLHPTFFLPFELRSMLFWNSKGRENLPSVFLSYSNADRPIVRRVAEGLRKAEIRVWFDETSIRWGENWVKEIERGLDETDFVVVFISPALNSTGWAKEELSFAMARQVSGKRVRLLPILLVQIRTCRRSSAQFSILIRGMGMPIALSGC
jgi:hypothetical protein